VNNQDDFQDDIDPKLQKLYRQLPKEQPSAELDAKILAAAKITTPKLTQNQKKTRHWQAPFALAASVVMVSSVALYMHEENPAAFDASVPTTQAPAAKMAKLAIKNSSTVSNIANDKSPVDQIDRKITTQKAKDTPLTMPDQAHMASTDGVITNGFKEHNLTAPAEKKIDVAKQRTEITSVDKSAKSVELTSIAKEQLVRPAKKETDQFTTNARAPAAYAPAPVSIPPPAPQVQPQPQVNQLPLQAGRLQADLLQYSNPASRQMSAAIIESDQPSTLEKSKAAPALSAAPMAAAPMSLGAVASSAMPMQRTERDEATTTTDAKQNMSSPLLSIEGVAIGMNREQLVTQGLTCYVDVCHLDLSQPQQGIYWGMPAQNGHLTAFLSHHVVTKLVLQQKNVQLNHVKTALSNVGIASHESCKEEKGVLLIGRQQGTNIFNVRSMGAGLSLAICQQIQ
jgi:hypothetical protein